MELNKWKVYNSVNDYIDSSVEIWTAYNSTIILIGDRNSLLNIDFYFIYDIFLSFKQL